LAVKKVIEAFESPACPGKHDGAKVVQKVLDLYDEQLNKSF